MQRKTATGMRRLEFFNNLLELRAYFAEALFAHSNHKIGVLYRQTLTLIDGLKSPTKVFPMRI
jgi:hypothetical protein